MAGPADTVKKYYFFDKEVGCLTASHSLSAGCGQLARLQAEVFSSPHMSPKKMIGLSFAAAAAKLYEIL